MSAWITESSTAASAALMGFAGVKRWNVLKWFPHSPNLTELTRKDTEECECRSEYVSTEDLAHMWLQQLNNRLVKWKMIQTLNKQITLKNDSACLLSIPVRCSIFCRFIYVCTFHFYSTTCINICTFHSTTLLPRVLLHVHLVLYIFETNQ